MGRIGEREAKALAWRFLVAAMEVEEQSYQRYLEGDIYAGKHSDRMNYLYTSGFVAVCLEYPGMEDYLIDCWNRWNRISEYTKNHPED